MDEKQLFDLLNRIAVSLEKLSNDGQEPEPDFQHTLDEYPHFDWSTINATVVQSDNDGPTHVQWGGKIWIRRSPSSNKFEPAIFYSRAHGKNADGENNYLRLIIFRAAKKAEPLPAKLATTMGTALPPKAAAPATQKPAAKPQYEGARTPENIKKAVLQIAEQWKSKPISEPKRAMIIPMILACFDNNQENNFLRVINFFFGKPFDMLNDGELISLYQWLQPHEVAGQMEPWELSVKEARYICDTVKEAVK